MMSHLLFCFLVISFGGMSSEKREVVLDSFVLLFDNLTADSLETEVSLHKNGAEDPSLIVKWNINNGDITAKWRMHNYRKIFMDGNKSIWIANIDKTYEGKYYIQSSQKLEAEIVVISGISHDTTTTRSQKNETEENENEEHEISLMKMPRPSTKDFENENEEQEEPLMKMPRPSTKYFERLIEEYPQLWQNHFGNLKWENIMQELNGDQQQGLREHCERLIEEHPQLWQNYFGNLKWENIMQLLNVDQQQGLRKHCDTKHRREEATIKHRRNHSSVLIREKRPYVDRCTFCKEKHIAMFVLPCKHAGNWYMPTCTKCGISQKPCESCSASNIKDMWTLH